MTLPKLKKGNWNYLALAFIFPVFAVLVLMIIGGYTPFGQYSMLYSDMYHQYYPFFKAFRQALLSGDSLLYSWNVGMGMDYLGLISYYLASPLNLLSVLVPEAWLLPYFSLLMPIKLGFASLFFAIFLKKIFGRDDLSLPLFGCFYGMCAWALGFQWNIMWLDSFALLPLVALGTVQLLKEKKVVLYTLTLFLSIFANYYIGFFTCIFILLTFICYQICRCKSLGRFFADLGRIALFSVLAIGMTAILELPALAALQNTQSSVNKFPDYFDVNIVSGELVTTARNAWYAFKDAKEAGEGGLIALFFKALWASLPPVLEGMGKIAGNMHGGLTPNFKEGLPNLYCGVGTIVFAFLFLTSRHVKVRDKICSVFLLVFFMLSFILRQLDYIWHGFHFTNMIPYRFSFLFSFVLLYMAYRAFCISRHFRLWQLIVAGVLYLGLLYCSEARNDIVFLAYNLVLFAVYMVVLLYGCRETKLPEIKNKETMREVCIGRIQRRKLASVVLAATMGLELVLNMVNFGIKFPCTAIYNYPSGTTYTASMIRYMKEREEDTLFYRAEVTHSQTLNDGALNGYNGISTFTSSANVRVTEFMRHMGYGAKNTYNRYCFEESSPVSNLFLNLKYMVERDGKVEENAYFDEIWHYGNVYLLENNAYLPLGFLAEKELGEFEFKSMVNFFLHQNSMFSAATGLNASVWNTVPNSWLTVEGKGVTLNSEPRNGYVSYKADPSGGTLIYRYEINRDGFMCLDVEMNARNNFSIFYNGKVLYGESISLPQTFSVCDVKKGDVVEVRASCKGNESNSMTIRAAILNDQVFREGYDILNANTWELTHFSNTKIEGTIQCDREGLLYTSIPYDGNWVVKVDGEEVESQLVGEAMMAVSLAEGEHHVQFTYRNKAFNLGWKISLACALLFVAIVVGREYWKCTRYQGKHLKK